MRWHRLVAAVLIVVFLLMLAGCSGAPSVSAIFGQQDISAKTISNYKFEVRFLKESKGSNYKSVSVAGNSDLAGKLLDDLSKSNCADKPLDAQFTPELRSDCEIVFTNGKGVSISFFYILQNNLLIYPQKTKNKEAAETLQYLYYTPGDTFASLIQDLQKSAKLAEDNSADTFHSMEELKSSVDPDELAEKGTEIDFEFFTDTMPVYTGTACQIYTSTDLTAVPQDCYLIATYGKTKTGEQEKLAVQGMESNSNYTKILVDEPDSSLESLDTGDTPDAYAILVKKDKMDLNKWIVFVDSDGNIMDIILPDGIKS